uniref:hypothetical protein n=1 Tax=Kuenenia stuttgartiensis TaxID=174633 RepID=UPI001B8B9FC9
MWKRNVRRSGKGLELHQEELGFKKCLTQAVYIKFFRETERGDNSGEVFRNRFVNGPRNPGYPD